MNGMGGKGGWGDGQHHPMTSIYLGGGGNFSRKENWILQERKRWVLVFKGTVSQDRHFLIFDA